jgi:pyruvate,water dikinase
LVKHQLLTKPTFEITQEFQLLRRLLKKITPLYLIDPDAANFNAKGCKTVHDIVRFIHQQAFQSLVEPGEQLPPSTKQGPKQLKSNPPLGSKC